MAFTKKEMDLWLTFLVSVGCHSLIVEMNSGHPSSTQIHSYLGELCHYESASYIFFTTLI